MSEFDFSTLITDRTNADVSSLSALLSKKLDTWTPEELEKFNGGMLKGGYWWTDLNRVTACMEYLDQELRSLGYESGYVPVVVHETQEPEESLLPKGYTQLEYIESSGDQYIDTGFKPNQNTVVEVIAKLNFGTGTSFIFSARDGANTSYGFPFGILFNGTIFRSDFGSSKTNFSSVPSYDKYLFRQSKSECMIGPYSVTNKPNNFQCNYNLFIFGSPDGGEPNYFLTGVLYSAVVFNNGEKIRDFIPCKSPSQQIGLYDLVGNSFYTNGGTGSFISGPEIPVKPQPEPVDPYTWYKEDNPTITQLQQYLTNISAIRSAFNSLQNAPGTPTSPRKLTIESANNIEKSLSIVESTILTMKKTFVACGSATCGGDYL